MVDEYEFRAGNLDYVFTLVAAGNGISCGLGREDINGGQRLLLPEGQLFGNLASSGPQGGSTLAKGSLTPSVSL
jgi:hypothetical protein